jgi:hypothetical protein
MRIFQKSFWEGKYVHLLFVLGVLCLWGLHFYDITADPSLLKSTEDIHDEAWWAENARQKILYDRWTVDGIAGALAAGPLTVAWHYIVFSIGGINFFTLRLISLIPFSVLILSLFVRSRSTALPGPEKASLRDTLLLLLCFPLVFDWSRLGHPEMLMGCLGIASFAIGRRDAKFNLIVAGFIAAVGLFVKGSFVYHFLAIGLVLSGSDYRHFFRRGFLFSTGAAIVVLPIWFGYYLPNAAFFETYQNLFAGEYYTWSQLLHPEGIIFRLIHLVEKPFINDPLSSILITILLLRFLSRKVPREKFSYSALLLFSFLLVLGSDFSPRRLVFPMLLLPFALAESHQYSKISWWKNGIVYWILSLQILPYCWPKAWLTWQLAGGGLDYSPWLWVAVFAQALLCAGLAYALNSFSPSNKQRLMLMSLPVLFWWIGIQFHTWHRLNCGIASELVILLLIVLGALCLLSCMVMERHRFNALAILSLLWILLAFNTRSHGVEIAANFLAKEGKPKEYAIGYGLPYTLTFLSPVSPVFHPDSERKLPIRWCIGVSSLEFPNRSMEADVKRFFPNCSAMHHTFGLYGKREEAWISERAIR